MFWAETEIFWLRSRAYAGRAHAYRGHALPHCRIKKIALPSRAARRVDCDYHSPSGVVLQPRRALDTAWLGAAKGARSWNTVPDVQSPDLTCPMGLQWQPQAVLPVILRFTANLPETGERVDENSSLLVNMLWDICQSEISCLARLVSACGVAGILTICTLWR